MRRRPIRVEQVDARWRIAVGDDTSFCYFDVDIAGCTTPLTAEAAKTLVGKLSALLAAERFADEEAARAALAGH